VFSIVAHVKLLSPLPGVEILHTCPFCNKNRLNLLKFIVKMGGKKGHFQGGGLNR
jgi:hypothetical protein